MVFFPRISLLTPLAVACSSRRSCCSSVVHGLLCARRVLAPRSPCGIRRAQQGHGPGEWVLPDAARPARLGTCPRRCCRRCATAASGWDQRSQANCFSLSPNCGFYQESLFQRAQTRSSAASLISSIDPHTPPALLYTFPPPAGRRPELPVHSAEAREAPAGRRWVGPISEDLALGLNCGMWQRRWDRREHQVSYRSARAVRAGGAADPPARPRRSGAISGDGAVKLALAHRVPRRPGIRPPRLLPTAQGDDPVRGSQDCEKDGHRRA